MAFRPCLYCPQCYVSSSIIALNLQEKCSYSVYYSLFFSSEIENYEDDEAVLQEFRKRCAIHRAAGTLVLRGMMVVDRVSNLTIDHLKPVSSSVWKVLKWDNCGPPNAGVYSVPSTNSSDHADDVQSFLLNFCLTNLS